MRSTSRDLMPDAESSDVPVEMLFSSRRVVVTIGIDEYHNLPRLRCAVSDALGVQDVLVRRFAFEAPVAPLINQAATKRAIEALVEDQLPKLLSNDDALILFFAGHGTTRLARVGPVTVEAGYLAPIDARGPDVFSDLVDMEQLLRKISMLPAHHILVVLDACHSGMALGSAVKQYRSAGSFVSRLSASRSRRVITSARRDESALDTGPMPGHSLFTGALIHGLTSGQADTDHNGVITSSELALCIQQWVGQASGSQQTPDYGAFELDERGELVLAMRYGAAEQATWGPAQSYGKPVRARIARKWWGIAAAMAGVCALAGLGITLRNGCGAPKPSVSAVAAAGAAPADPCADGLPICRAACDKGQQDACVAFGKLLHAGKGIEADTPAAFKLFKTACDKSQAEGCVEAGLDLLRGTGVSKNTTDGTALLAKSCGLKFPLGCYHLGVVQRDSVPPNASATDSFHKACEGGHLAGCAAEGEMIFKRDPAKAVSLYKRACDGKYGDGCNLLGLSYLNGAGDSKPDPKRAVEFFQRGCDYGSGGACYSLGNAYKEGKGVQQDAAYAVELFAKACTAGYKPACAAGAPKSQQGGAKAGGTKAPGSSDGAPKEGDFCSGFGSWGAICGGYCLNTYNNNQHCGRCGNSCSGSMQCIDALCRAPPTN